jgi:hypothetical protein
MLSSSEAATLMAIGVPPEDTRRAGLPRVNASIRMCHGPTWPNRVTQLPWCASRVRVPCEHEARAIVGAMHSARWTALVALMVGISCGGRTPLYTSEDTGFDGPAGGPARGDRGSCDPNTCRGNSQNGPDDQMMGTGTGPSFGSGGSSAPGGGFGTAGSSTSSGGSGTTSTGPGGPGGSPGVACPNPSVVGTELIDDMNDGNRFIPSINGRSGAWTVYHDETPAPMHPDIAQPFAMEQSGDPCRMLAAHVYGGPFSVWGAGFGFGLGSPYNAKGYAGIGFWARFAGPPVSVQVAFPDKDTELAGGLCDPSLNGGNSCYDHYSARRSMTGQWQWYEVRFAELQQLGFGRRGQAFDPTTLFEVQFLIPQNAKFDVWIDDVVFLGH